jgi:hypothetical protein
MSGQAREEDAANVAQQVHRYTTLEANCQGTSGSDGPYDAHEGEGEQACVMRV